MANKLIIITGTPGVGKSTLAKKLVKVLGKRWKRLDLHQHYQELASGYDREGKCYEIPLKELEKLVRKLKEESNLIFDSHLAHLLPRSLVDLCLILTCSDLKLLRNRLQKRKYSPRKIEENLQAEIFQNCLEEAKEKGHKVLVFDVAKEKGRVVLETSLRETRKLSAFYIIIRGPLGCGKTTIAKKVAKHLKARHISIDKILDQHNLTQDKERGYISQRSFRKANSRVISLAKKALEKGTPVIFDGNFYWKSQIEDLIKRLPFPHKAFTLKCPLGVCIRRDKLRKETHGRDAAMAVYKKSIEFTYGRVIDVTKPLSQSLKKIISHLSH